MLTAEEINAAAKCADSYPPGNGQKWYWKTPEIHLPEAVDRLTTKGPQYG